MDAIEHPPLPFPPLPLSSDQANDMRRRELQSMIPRRARRFTLEDRQANQNLPTSIDPVAQEQGIVNSHDNISTCLMRMYHQQFLQNPESSSTAIFGDGNINTSDDAKMPRPIQSGFTQQGTQGTHMSMMNRRYCDYENEFLVVRNVSQRAMMSNMLLTATLHAPQQPIAHHEGMRSFEEQRQSSAPEVLQTSEQAKSMYQVRELEVHDSDVVDMWLACDIEE